MAARFVNIDHDTPLLLPPDVRQWVPAQHLVHFVMDAVAELDLRQARVNERGTGDAQYPPAMMLGLLIYSYATGLFSSRQIERATHENVAVRLLCADTHPDHDTICAFRRQHKALLERSFAQVLELAARCQVLQVGGITVAIDGSKVLAAASKHAALSYDRAGEQLQQLELEIAQLLAKAEAADATPLDDGLTIPEEIERRQQRKVKLAQARAEMEARALVRAADEQAEHEGKVAARGAQRQAGRTPRGPEPKPPGPAAPDPKDQFNFTDPESRIMKAGTGDHFVQAYNAQAAVEVESRLIVGQRICTAANDKEQLVPTLAAIVPAAGPVAQLLIDSGFVSSAAVQAVERDAQGQPTGTEVLAAIKREHHGRTVADLEKKSDPPAPGPEASFEEKMAHRVATKAGRARYKLRQQTVEPVFGIIKEAMGFRRFSLRGLAKVSLEWTLVTLAYNVRRLHRVGATLATA
jgi:transposase